jgi:ABC-type multidrug transport system ATPase subunit
VRARIGMVAHSSHVYDDLTALENLRFWATMGGLDASPARLRERLRAVELDTVADERARTFSAGMKRRLGLARVTLGQPRLLLLDEPFNGLDRRGQKWLGEFLLAFKAGGGAIVLATHGFASALAVADRAAILLGGRIALDRAAAGLEREALHRLYDELIEAER